MPTYNQMLELERRERALILRKGLGTGSGWTQTNDSATRHIPGYSSGALKIQYEPRGSILGIFIPYFRKPMWGLYKITNDGPYGVYIRMAESRSVEKLLRKAEKLEPKLIDSEVRFEKQLERMDQLERETS